MLAHWSQLVPNMSTDTRGHEALLHHHHRRVQALCESRGGHPGLPVLNSPRGLCKREVTLSLNFVTQSSGAV